MSSDPLSFTGTLGVSVEAHGRETVAAMVPMSDVGPGVAEVAARFEDLRNGATDTVLHAFARKALRDMLAAPDELAPTGDVCAGIVMTAAWLAMEHPGAKDTIREAISAGLRTDGLAHLVLAWDEGGRFSVGVGRAGPETDGPLPGLN